MRLQLNTILFVGLLCIISGCKSFKDFDSQKKSEQSEINQQAIPQILTLVFEINSDNSVHLVSTTNNHGELRKNGSDTSPSHNKDLIISFLDTSKNVCNTQTIANPLEKKVEYSDDFRVMQAKIVKLDSAFFSIRVQYEECMQNILIEKIIDSSNKTYEKLIEIPIRLNVYE